MNRSVAVANAGTALGREVCAALERSGALITAQPHASGAQLVEQAVRTFGCLDALVSCHALRPEMSGRAESLALDAFVGGIASNLSDTFFSCQAAAAQMFQQRCTHSTPARRGCIVNVTSVAGVLALPGHAAFCSAMAGLTAATSVLAAEWGPRGIRVTAVGAGLSTESLAGALPAGGLARRVPPHSVVRLDKVAEAVCFLLDDAADGVAGSTLYVDGGWLADGYWE